MRKLPLQIPSERRVQLKQEQMRIPRQTSRDLARVHAFTRTIFCNHSPLAEIHLAGDAFHQCFRAGNNRRDLKWTLQKSFEEQGAHKETNSRLARPSCPVMK